VGDTPGHEPGLGDPEKDVAGLIGGGELKAGLGILAGIKAFIRLGAKDIAKSGVEILIQDGNHIVAAFKVANGEGQVVTELVREGDTLILRGTHIEGQATLKEALSAAKAFGREQGARKVIIEGGKRTTGANPGHIPRPIELETGL
jgi:hypothetical protein